MKKTLGWIVYHQGIIYPVILFLLTLYLAVINRVPGTYLSGWDTLHPEFNFPLAFQRLIFGVFRTDQGLGAVAAHAHMADFPRVIIIYLLSFVFPNNLLRYFFIVSNLTIGVLGAYFFINYLLKENDKKFINVSAFLGALFYLLNLGTLQQFYVPFEMFTIQYAFLPWLFLTANIFLNKSTKKNLLIFGIISLLSAPMAYASTLWFAYFFSLIAFLIFFLKSNFKKVLILILATLVINSFWLIPNLYFLFSGNAAFIPEAKINKIFSEEAFNYNKSYGNLIDAVIFKNFLFDWPVYSGNNHFDYLLQNWIEHLKNFYWIGYVMLIPIFTGVVNIIIKKDKKWLGLLAATIVSLVFIVNLNPPFESIFLILRNSSSIFREALRFPFTKFSIIMMMGFSVFFGLGSYLTFDFFNKTKLNFKIKLFLFWFQLIGVAVLLIIYMLPVFKGDLISKKMQVNIPSNYFQTFEWFNTKAKDERVAPLPVHSFWGWIYYNWGFQGAQFITFGIKQPVLDRDYDRWNPHNEQYFREMSYAVYSQNIDLIEKVLEKYKIKYLILDENVIDPNSTADNSPLFIDQIKSMFKNSKNITLAKKFGEISIYEYKNNLNKNFISSIDNPKQLNSINLNYEVDWAYLKDHDYIVNTDRKTINNKTLYYFPFDSLSTNQGIVKPDLLSLEGSKLILKPKDLPSGSILTGSSFLDSEPLVLTDIYTEVNNGKYQIIFKPSLQNLGKNKISYEIPMAEIPTILYLNIDNNQTLILKNLTDDKMTYQGSAYLNTKSFNNLAFYSESQQLFTNSSLYLRDPFLCSNPNKNQEITAFNDDKSITIQAKNAEACVKIPLEDLISQNELTNFKTLINISFNVKSNSYGGFCVYDKLSNRCIREQRYINNKKINFYLTPTADELNRYELDLYSDDFKGELSETKYSNISVSKLSSFYILSISPNDIESMFNNQTLKIGYNQNLVLDYISNPVEDVKLDEERYRSNICSNKKPKAFNVKYNSINKYIEYSSEDGSSCDFFTFPDLSHNAGYLVEIENQNEKGLPLRICLANVNTKRCDIYSALPANKIKTKNIILLPPSNDGGYGYNLHLDNYSVGNVESANRIYSIKLYSFPYNWLSQMQFASDGKNKESKIILSNPKQVLPGFFTVRYNSTNGGVIVLNQTYENGWIMLGNSKHYMVNGWANGWIVDGFNKQAIIIYWPQLLEFLGFLMLIGGGCIFIKNKLIFN